MRTTHERKSSILEVGKSQYRMATENSRHRRPLSPDDKGLAEATRLRMPTNKKLDDSIAPSVTVSKEVYGYGINSQEEQTV